MGTISAGEFLNFKTSLVVKRIFLIAALFVCFATTQNLIARSYLSESIEKAADIEFEKPKPGSKRWLRSQTNRRNTRRKKYPRMRRGGQADWTIYSASQPKSISGQGLPEQTGTLVVQWGSKD